MCESNLNRAKKYANKSPVYFTVFRAFLYIVPCTRSCRRIRNSLSCRTICETICLSLFSNMGSQAYAVAWRRAHAALCSGGGAAAARWLFYAAARCHHHHLVHLGEYFHGDHFWKILAFSRRNLRLFTFFRIPSALARGACSLAATVLTRLTKEVEIEETQNAMDLHTEICMRYFTHD